MKVKSARPPKEAKFDSAAYYPGVKTARFRNACVSQLASYSGNAGSGCFALMNRELPPYDDSVLSTRFFIVITPEHRLQTMLELALVKEESVDIICRKYSTPPDGPWNGAWDESYDVYELLQVMTHWSGLLGSGG